MLLQRTKDTDIEKLISKSPSYSKSDIIQLVIDLGELEYDLTKSALHKRFSELVKFLNTNRVRLLLDQSTNIQKGDYFYNDTMHLTLAEGESYKSYDYNVIDAVFLATLLSLSNLSFLKKIRNPINKTISKDEEIEWTLSYRKVLNKFIKILADKEFENAWGLVSIQLETFFYRFSYLSPLKTQAEEASSELKELVDLFEGLTNEDKVKLYEKSMRKNIRKILNEIDEELENKKEKKPEEYSEYLQHKKFVNIDKQVDGYNYYPKSIPGLSKKLQIQYFDEKNQPKYRNKN